MYCFCFSLEIEILANFFVYRILDFVGYLGRYITEDFSFIVGRILFIFWKSKLPVQELRPYVLFLFSVRNWNIGDLFRMLYFRLSRRLYAALHRACLTNAWVDFVHILEIKASYI